MNRSGHHEVRDPDWMSRNEAKLSPNTLDTDASTVLQNSLTSLNLDSLTVADLDHFSVRSLPVVPSSGGASIATSADAPWNESPQSTRTGRSPRRTIAAVAAPPPGVSALDHLQNSISSLNLGAGIHMPPVHQIITEEASHNEDDSEADMECSVASLLVQDLGNNNDMDATAHAGNVSKNHHSRASAPLYPASPQRPMRGYVSNPSSPQRRSRYALDSSLGGSSITSRASTRYHHQQPHHPTAYQQQQQHQQYRGGDEPSFSTLGDDDFEDDDNVEIIKMLRNQVDRLKEQLLAEQQKNQDQKLSFETSKASIFQQQQQTNSPHDSYSLASFCDDEDSFGADSDSASKDDGSVKSLASLKERKKLAVAESAVSDSIAALKASFRKQALSSPEQQSDDNDMRLMDELVLCELENHVKNLQKEHAAAMENAEARFKKQSAKQTTRIAELEQQLKQQP